MQTYTKQVEEKRLVIEYDADAESPRQDDNIGHFFTKESRYKSPDGNVHELYRLMLATEDEARDTKNHIELMKKAARLAFLETKNEDLHVIEIHPIYRYEHSNVVYKRGQAAGFDYANCGFYFVTAQSLSGRTETAKSIAKAIDNELECYTQWANGEIYQFMLYDKDGDEVESAGGFYSLDDIKGYLGEEWEKENMADYFKS